MNTDTLDTNPLIESLALRAEPLPRLLAPWRRTALWLALSLLYVGVVAALHLAATPLPGPIGFRLVVEQAAILATAVTAAIAAFSSVVPGRDRRLALCPRIDIGPHYRSRLRDADIDKMRDRRATRRVRLGRL